MTLIKGEDERKKTKKEMEKYMRDICAAGAAALRLACFSSYMGPIR